MSEENKYTVEDVERAIEAISKKREEVAEKKRIHSVADEELTQMENEAMRMLQSVGKKSYKGEQGTITRVVKWRVNLPKTPEARDAFFAYLKEKGLFENLITVNSQQLNSFYMQEWDQVKENDPMEALNFRIPGIEEPKEHETISFRKG